MLNFLSINPRKIFGIAIPEIKEGAAACLTLFNTDEEYVFDEEDDTIKIKKLCFYRQKIKRQGCRHY